MTLHPTRALDIIRSSNGRIFSALFIKADGTERRMIARLGVTKGVKGTGKPAGLHTAVVRVFDMRKRAFRSIPVDRLLTLKVNGALFELSI